MNASKKLLPQEPWPQRLSRIFAWIAGAFILFGCAGLIGIDVATRALLGRGTVASFELSGYAFACAIGLGLAFAVTSKSHIRVDILLEILPQRLRIVCHLLAAMSLSLVALALAWYCWGTLSQSIAMDAKSISTLQVPMAIPQSIWFVGILWFAGIAAIVPVQAALLLFAGDRDGFEALVGNLRVAEEIEQTGSGAKDRAP